MPYLSGAGGDPNEFRGRVAFQSTRGIPADEADFFDFRSNAGGLTMEAGRIARRLTNPSGEQLKDLAGKLNVVGDAMDLGDLDAVDRMLFCAFANLFGHYDYTTSTPAAGVEQWLFSRRGADDFPEYLTILQDDDFLPRVRFKDVLVSSITISASPGGTLGIVVERVAAEHDFHGAVVQTEGGKSAVAITSITRASNTATVTTTAPHGLTTGDVVVISGAVETDYNGDYVITVTGTSAFTYTVANTPTTPATGTIVYATNGLSISGITRSGAVATATTAVAHGLTSGDTVRISGAVETEYNGDVVATVTAPTTFTYPVSGTPATPATGTIVYEALNDPLPVFSNTWSGNWDDDDTDSDLYTQFNTVTAAGVHTIAGKVGSAASYSSTFTAKAGNDSAGIPIFTRMKKQDGTTPGPFSETPKMYVPAGIRPGATFRVPMRRTVRWTQSFEIDRPIGSVNLDFLISATEGSEPESIRIEGGFTAVLANSNLVRPDTPGRQGATTQRQGPLTCVITPTRDITDLRFQKALHQGTPMSAVVDMRTDTNIGVTVYPYRGVLLVPAVVPSGPMRRTTAGGTNRDESPALQAGLPDAAFTYDGITTSAPVAFALQSDITEADMGLA